jgi:diguanylate cyclase (GGDEF)-like protein/PAS domain S-box-containing protein
MRKALKDARGLIHLKTRWAHAAAAFALAAVVYLSGGLAPLERSLADFRFTLTAREASGDLLLVGIDPRSLKQLDVWPWPRRHHAAVVDALIEAGAAQVALDIDFSAKSSPDEDEALAAAIARAPDRIILPVFRQRVTLGDGQDGTAYTAPLPRFRRHARLASVNTVPDGDGLIRRHSLRDIWQDELVATMPAVLAGRGAAPPETFHIDYGIRPESIPVLSYIDVLQGRFHAGSVRGKTVIIGAFAVELGDIYAVPVYTALPGPLVQALTYESLVQGRTLRRSALWVVLAGAAIVILSLARRFQSWSWRGGLAAVAAVAVGSFALSVAVQAVTPMMLEITPWTVAAASLYGIALFRRIERQGVLLTLRGSRLRHRSALMRSVVECSSEAILTISEDLVVEFANPAAEFLLGTEQGGLAGQPVSRILPSITSADDMESMLRDPHRGAELEGRARNGVVVDIEATVDKMSVDGATQYVVIARDIGERKAQQEVLQYLALHDSMTGLPNRTLLMDRLDHAIASSKRSGARLALLILDLDRFKEINDTLGHAVGDSLLIAVGETLGAPLRASDTVARLGGDEFAILLPAISDVGHTRDIAGRVAGATNQPFPVEDLMLDIGVSIGAALYPDHGETAEDLLRSADVAMYMAKRDGTTIAVYDEDRDHNSVRNLSMSGELRQAMDDDELVLFFQPQIEITTGRLVGAEALIRWDHPRYGVVPPVEFITLAEQSGLIGPLTRWILRSALEHLGAWQAEDYDIGISVNLSPRNLLEEDLSESVARLMQLRGIRPGSLTLEITEDAIITDPDRALAAMRHLRACGVRLSIDDFGTGHSSLAYLKTLPVDELKIDKSFVTQMADGTRDAVIVRAMIDLAHDLGLTVVAEGIESESLLEALRELRCDFGQGYHLGRPMRKDAFERWMQEWLTTTPSDSGADTRELPGARRRSMSVR